MAVPPDLRCVSSVEDGGRADEHRHLVQLYETEGYLAEVVSDFVIAGLRAGETAIIVATKEHRQAIDELVGNSDLDLQELRNEGRYVLLDAGQTLARFMVDGEPEPALFSAAMGAVIARAAEAGHGVRIFGEMVALLWAEGNVPAALRLEELWNEVAETHPFSLLCGYPIESFGTDTGSFGEVCARHSQVIPTESYSRLGNRDERLRAVTELQMRARAGDARADEAQRHALDLNDTVVQGLAAAKMALELKEYEMLQAAVADTLQQTTELVSHLLDRGLGEDALGPGDLRSSPRSA